MNTNILVQRGLTVQPMVCYSTVIDGSQALGNIMFELSPDLKRDSRPTHTVGAICPLFLMKRPGEQKIYTDQTRYRVVPFVTGVGPLLQEYSVFECVF